MFGISCCGFTHNHVPLSSVLLYLVRFSLSWGGGNRNSSWMRLCASVGQCWLSFLWDVRLISGCRWCQPVHYKFSINPVPNGFTIHLGSFSSVQSLSRVQLFSTPWITARQASLSITNSRSLPKLMFIESVMPSNYLIFCRPLLLLPSIFPSIRVFASESVRWPKYWSFSFNISPSNEHPELISFRMDWLDLLAVQETLKSLLQHHSSKASVLWYSAFFLCSPTLTSIHDHWKNHSLD